MRCVHWTCLIRLVTCWASLNLLAALDRWLHYKDASNEMYVRNSTIWIFVRLATLLGRWLFDSDPSLHAASAGPTGHRTMCEATLTLQR